MGKIIGIDLGTTNSVVAVSEGSEVTVITNPQGYRTTPSVVGFTAKGERIVGQPARNQGASNAEHTVYSIKRFMGRRRAEVEAEEKLVPYTVSGGPNDPVKVEARGESFTPPQISAMVLGYLKKYAEDYLGEPVTQAVITVPAYFNDAQRQATKDAGEIAGLEVMRIINEPTAAALAYSLDTKAKQKILVFDLGGGTFDVSVLEIGEETADSGEKTNVVQVLSTNGDTHLGGDNYDEAIVNFVADEFKKRKGVDLRNDMLSLARLKEACEKAKIELSSTQATKINLPFITAIDNVGEHIDRELTRAQFDAITKHLTERCRAPVENALKDAAIDATQIDTIVMVGGSTRIPAVQDLVKTMFPGKELNKSVNPDEVVAIGAAIQGSVINKERSDIVLLDVTPLTLGIEIKGGLMEPIVKRNTTIPHTEERTDFTNAETNQSSVDIKIFQGERRETKNNRELGLFKLSLAPYKSGEARISVKFDIDVNGILYVTATDLKTKKASDYKVVGSSNLSKEDIARAKQDAETYAKEDEARALVIEAKNRADSTVFSIEHDQSLKFIPNAEGKKKLDEAIEALKKARDSQDVGVIDKAIADVDKAVTSLKTRSTPAPAPTTPPPVGAAVGATKSDEGDDPSNHQSSQPDEE